MLVLSSSVVVLFVAVLVVLFVVVVVALFVVLFLSFGATTSASSSLSTAVAVAVAVVAGMISASGTCSTTLPDNSFTCALPGNSHSALTSVWLLVEPGGFRFVLEMTLP